MKTPSVRSVRSVVSVGSLLVLSGCASYQLPPVTAAKIVYDRSDPIGGTHIEAVNLRVENGTVKAARATWVTSYPSWKVSVTIEDYERKLTPP